MSDNTNEDGAPPSGSEPQPRSGNTASQPAEPVTSPHAPVPGAPQDASVPPPVPNAPKGGASLAALIVGIVALLFAVIPGLCFVAFVPAIVAIVMGAVALVRGRPRRGLALTGLIIGAVSFILAIVVSIATIVVGVSSAAVNDAGDAASTLREHTAPVESAPTKAAPKDEAEPTQAAKAPVPADVVYKGSGDSMVKITIPDGMDGPGVATITHKGSSNFAVWGLDDAMNQKGLLVNTIGDYRGTVLFNNGLSSGVTSLQVTADGAWTVTLRSLKKLREFTGNGVAGTGDDVVVYRGDAGAATITHDGKSNFAVWSYGERTDLVVNEIGAYSGTVRWTAGPKVVAVSADGNWKITVD